MGTADVMFAYAARPQPYTLACCEGYVQRNIQMRCFARVPSMLVEEFSGGEAGVNQVSNWSAVAGLLLFPRGLLSAPTVVFSVVPISRQSLSLVSGESHVQLWGHRVRIRYCLKRPRL